MRNQFKNRLYSLILAVLVSSLFLLSSCGDDDDDVNLAEAIIGTWLQTSFEYRDCDDSTINDSGSCGSDCEVATFDSSGTVTIDNFASGTYTINGDQITVNGESFRASISGNTLTLTFDNPDDGCTDIFRYRKQ